MNPIYSKNRILFVPGKNPKPPEEQHREQLWRCLLHGVRRSHPDIAANMAQNEECFSIIPWNPLYYNKIKPIEPDLPWIDCLLGMDGPTVQDKQKALSLRRKITKLFYVLGDHFPWFINFIPDPWARAAIKETLRYFNNQEDIACRVREMLKSPLRASFERNERIMIISHSLGSVIAYDTLLELWNIERIRNHITCFLTIGSPLGSTYVRKRLKGFSTTRHQYPGNMTHWENISAHGDMVALDTTLGDNFHKMIEQGLIESIKDHPNVFNYFHGEKGLNVHRSYGYLVNPVVGETIAQWWNAG